MLNRYVALDIETTGLNPWTDSIIEIGVVRVIGGEIADTFHTLVQPGIKLPLGIKKLTGINDDMMAGAPRFDQIKDSLAGFLEGENILGHNVGFDRGFIEAAMKRKLPNPGYDTLELARILMPMARSYRLPDLCSLIGQEMPAAHRAVEDALAAVRLYEHMEQKLCRLDGQDALFLEVLLKKTRSVWGEALAGFAGILSGRVSHYQPKNHYHSAGEGELEYFYEKQGRWGYTDPGEVKGVFSANGLFALSMPQYEERFQQADMAGAVAGAFNDKKILLVEAGTGTGKSIAYLVPAMLWSAAGGPRVVVSTKSINLQDQLWYKDIPQVMKCLGINVKTALAKGRSNYICLRRWNAVLAEGPGTEQEASFHARLLVWVNETKSGDKVELNLNYQEEEFWQTVCSDTDNCTGNRCRYFSGRCFFIRARREAESSGLIITNHALLFADIKTGNMVLPDYGPLIIDEAHHLEEVATEQLGRQVSRSDIRRFMSGAGKNVMRCWELVPGTDPDKWVSCLVSLREDLSRLRQAADDFFIMLKNYLSRQSSGEGDHLTLRIRRESGCGDGDGLPWAEYENLIFHLKGVLGGLRKVMELIQAWADENDSWEEKAREFMQLVSSGEEMLENLEFNYRCDDLSHVYWVSASGQGDWFSASLNSSPVRVGQLLHERLFSVKEAVVLTSATLTVNDRFDYFAERAGIDRIFGDRVVKKNIESPFEFEKQSLLCLVNDLPAQGSEADNRYTGAVARALVELVSSTGGKTLALFTSHRVLREVHGKIKAALEEQNIGVLGHNIDGNRSRLVEEFMRMERAVLLGAASLWEGVDIPGEALTSVVIVKLPFSSPSVPVIEARMEDLETAGRNYFYEYYLPMAVIKFKQGFGRLIRTGSDRGVVVVLDGRVAEKGYGRHFLQSLPLKAHFRGSLGSVKKKIADWLTK